MRARGGADVRALMPRSALWTVADHLAARITAAHPEQGWSTLCNGVIVFDDGGELRPDSHATATARPALARPLATAA